MSSAEAILSTLNRERVAECAGAQERLCPPAGVLARLSVLEVQARSRRAQPAQPSRVKELRAEVEALRGQREQLRAEIETHTVGLPRECWEIEVSCAELTPFSGSDA